MFHDSDATAAAGMKIVANSSGGLAAGSAASPAVTGLAPAGAEEVSAQAMTAFAAEGVRTLAEIASAQEALMQAGAAIAEIAGMYSALDAGAAETITRPPTDISET